MLPNWEYNNYYGFFQRAVPSGRAMQPRPAPFSIEPAMIRAELRGLDAFHFPLRRLV